jgi:hypothetical protein
MTSSTFKSISGVKIVALQNPQCLPLSAAPFSHRSGQIRTQDGAQSQTDYSHPPCFDLDSDSDSSICGSSSSSRRNQRKEVATCQRSGLASITIGQHQAAMHEGLETSCLDPRKDPHDQAGCSGPRRNLLGRLAVDVVGVSFYKAAASQHRVEGAPVYLVQFFIVDRNFLPHPVLI